jgi:hypothetical protein
MNGRIKDASDKELKINSLSDTSFIIPFILIQKSLKTRKNQNFFSFFFVKIQKGDLYLRPRWSRGCRIQILFRWKIQQEITGILVSRIINMGWIQAFPTAFNGYGIEGAVVHPVRVIPYKKAIG